jgi:hypothetical protein
MATMWDRTRGLKPCKLYDDNYDDDDDDDDGGGGGGGDDDRARATIGTLKFEDLMAVTISLVCETVLWPSRDAVRTFLQTQAITYQSTQDITTQEPIWLSK